MLFVPQQNIGEGSSKKQFEEISKAFESLVLGENGFISLINPEM
jgi:hypothetical protein